ncbi:MAG TPA: hypothetical protein PKN96_04505, partial [Flavobacterium sp.]|uniref:hypothetical protein n=1 Tax=Flavobacterium sp. TaxID=239 RepID=UPI002CE1DF99
AANVRLIILGPPQYSVSATANKIFGEIDQFLSKKFEQTGQHYIELYPLSEKYFEQEESLFSKYDGEKRINVDSLKTHPDCSTRIILAKKYFNNTLKENITKSEEFDLIKKKSINQNLYNLFSEKSFGISLYEALKLYKNDKDNAFYKNIILMNLIEIQKSRNSYTINKYVPSYDKKYNSSSLNRFVSFLNNIKVTDFDTIITNFKQ